MQILNTNTKSNTKYLCIYLIQAQIQILILIPGQTVTDGKRRSVIGASMLWMVVNKGLSFQSLND